MTHACPDCGIEHGEPEPVVVEDNSDKAAEHEGEAAVEIARLETKRDVKVAQIQSRAIDEEARVQIAALAAEIEVLRTAAAPRARARPSRHGAAAGARAGACRTAPTARGSPQGNQGQRQERLVRRLPLKRPFRQFRGLL